MILILSPDTKTDSEEFRQLEAYLDRIPNVRHRVHQETGEQQLLTEVYLIGDTASVSMEDVSNLPAVDRVVRISEEYRVLGRHKDDNRATWFDYNGVRFGQDNLHVFAGLCAVNTREHVEFMMRALQEQGQVETREMYRTFNCGVGMVICVPAAQLDRCLSILEEQGETAWVLGCIEAGDGEARVELNV